MTPSQWKRLKRETPGTPEFLAICDEIEAHDDATHGPGAAIKHPRGTLDQVVSETPMTLGEYSGTQDENPGTATRFQDGSTRWRRAR